MSVVDASTELAESLARIAPGPSALDLPHGMHFDIPEEQYHRRVFGLASKHMLDLIGESPLTYKSYIETPEDPEAETPEHFLIGNATGCATLEPERFRTDYACEPNFGDCRKKENKAKRDTWRAEYGGASVLTPKQYRDAVGMAASVRSHPRIAALLDMGSHSEVTLRWADPETRIECKARLDLWVPRVAVTLDLKTTQDARTESFAKDCERYGYADQAAMYLEGLSVLGFNPGPFLFGVVKKSSPYLRAVYGMPEHWLESATQRVHARLRLMADCFDRDEWFGLPEEIQMLERHRWARD
jgi:hypothetical protein